MIQNQSCSDFGFGIFEIRQNFENWKFLLLSTDNLPTRWMDGWMDTIVNRKFAPLLRRHD